jgi:hypothetical protein
MPEPVEPGVLSAEPGVELPRLDEGVEEDVLSMVISRVE